MGEKTGIQWTDHTFNPWWGCEKVSPACKHCYAETFSTRLGLPLWGGADTARRMASEKTWSEPVRWNRAAEKTGERKRVFCASMADVFEDRADLAAPRARLFRLVAETPWLDWLLLTKRPEHAYRLWHLAALHAWDGGGPDVPAWGPNVWLGTTVEDQQQADKRIPHLLAIPAAVRFLSVEPMLGAMDMQVILSSLGSRYPRSEIDWIIVGGESGPRARHFDLDAARRVVADCKSAGVAVFVKQMGERWARETGTHGQDAHGGTPELWPEDLRVREMPTVRP